ncbi:MAG: CSLREA domain-containing protein [bacterium]
MGARIFGPSDENAGARAARRLVLGVLALVLGGGVAEATTITVTGTADENSSSLPNVVCTLREAVIAANTNAAVGACAAGSVAMDTIVLPAGTYGLTLAGTGEDAAQTGDLDLLGDVEIVGAGASATTIDANGLDRIFDVRARDVDLRLSGVTLRGGNATVGVWGKMGGAVSLTGTDPLPPFGYTDCTACTLTLEDSVVRDNVAIDGGAGVFIFGASAASHITRSTFTNNQSSTVSDVYITVSSIEITDSTLDANVGAGVAAVGAAGGLITLDRSTVSNNGAGVGVDGFDVPGLPYLFGSATIRNSTISGNAYVGLYGGNAYVTVESSTIVAPTGAIAVQGAYSTTFANTLVSGYCFPGSYPTSFGGNLESPGNLCGFTGTGDQVNVANPKLGPLGSYGGYTKTHNLQPGSPAIGAGLAANCPATDQRGIARPAPASGNCDVGAYEATGCGASLSVAGAAPLALALRRRRPRRC